VEPAELAALLAGDDPPVALDVRWTLAGADHAGYLAGHVPTAVFADLDRDLAGPPGVGGRHPLPDAAPLQRFWRSVGIDDDSTVVAYDDSDSSPAARAWWLLRWCGLTRVRVLDGGLAAWRAAGLPVRTGSESVQHPGAIEVRPGGMPTVGVEQVETLGRPRIRSSSAVAAGSLGVLLDARAAPRYRGEVEPIDPVAGHIPGSVNLPHIALMGDDRRFRDSEAIAAAFRAAGVDADSTAAASCGSGVTACLLVLAGQLVGLDVALYPGSYSQWCALERPVAVGG
jgi:thiosulfate/3-mercaptopyruvate sulfurtransferase